MAGTARRIHVLVVEDQRLNLEHCQRVLARRGYDVTPTRSAEEARAAIASDRPDVVLLDVFMPKVSGFELLDELRGDARTSTIPVILTSALTDTKHIVEGLARGANDYVTKPIVVPILIARIEALLRATALVKRLEVQTELLARLAAYDELTGVYNRRSLFHTLETEVSRCQRYGRALSVLMLDLDHFKRINDTHGHAAGDAALRDFAATVQSVLRSMDVVCRYGGEEFCVLLPETDLVGAARAAERVRAAVESRAVTAGEARLSLTVSVGASSWRPDGSPRLPDLLAEADAALLAAKRAGRNRVRLFDHARADVAEPD